MLFMQTYSIAGEPSGRLRIERISQGRIGLEKGSPHPYRRSAAKRRLRLGGRRFSYGSGIKHPNAFSLLISANCT